MEELILQIRKLENRIHYLENKVQLLELELKTHSHTTFPQPPNINPPYYPMYPIRCSNER